MQAGRCLLLVAIVLLIHWQHQRDRARRTTNLAAPPLTDVQQLFPTARKLQPANDLWNVLTADDEKLGRVVQTSPTTDDIVGFSGPTNVLIGFDSDDKLRGLRILGSEDTRDHVESIVDSQFLQSLDGLNRKDVLNTKIDAVSGATLTCLAIEQSVRKRLGGIVTPGKFEEPLGLADVQKLFESATTFRPPRADGLSEVLSGAQHLGFVLRTSPIADNVIGYQGPNDVLIGFSPEEQVVGFALLRSYDNQPYVRYVREDWNYPTRFNEFTRQSLSSLDLEAAGIEGVAGATMTSIGVARAMMLAAKESLNPPAPAVDNHDMVQVTARDVGTMLITVMGLVIGLTSLRGRKRVRVGFQLLLIGYLGLMNGDMLSQALLVGWAKSGVSWTSSVGLVFLTGAAFVVPVFAGRNIYCSHLCPHGAVQQLVRNRLSWRVKLSKSATNRLSLVPGLLLLWVVVVATSGVAFSLVDIEPFDAWLFRIAGLATIAIAVVGLVASLFVPMAYCRFGCPTGALLQFVRTNRRSSDFTTRDGFAIGCLIVGAVLVLAN